MQFPEARILTFARVPRAGLVKTRLIPVLGEVGACVFHAACLRHTLQCLAGTGLAKLELWLDSSEHGELQVPGVDADIITCLQQGDDLGQRMANAVSRTLADADMAVLIGTDAPMLDVAYLEQAMRQLRNEADVVMGPAEDGGYVLLGLKQPCPQLFEGMPWGEDGVARLTRERCLDSGLKLAELPTLWDVDRAADLERLCRESTPGLASLKQVLTQQLPRLCAESPLEGAPLRE